MIRREKMDRIMRIAAAAALAAAMTLAAGCANTAGSGEQSGAESGATSEAEAKSAADSVSELEGKIELPSMAEVTSDNLHTFLGIDPEKVTEFSARICASGAMPDEFGVFVAADGEAAEELVSVLENRIEKQRDTYKDYTPDEMYKFDDCFARRDGERVFYAICADNELAADILKG